ncbi:hypothetical protein TorRG33x02_101680 [Trema orientale]|uniref:Uncharacterized protein n=1 Tax=Trema orientale TaxID=63057 RepID=A0A2P5F8M4_TREOI|nr:hypothetical protein TorRG33x02_101680 [Trema orientale]
MTLQDVTQVLDFDNIHHKLISCLIYIIKLIKFDQVNYADHVEDMKGVRWFPSPPKLISMALIK